MKRIIIFTILFLFIAIQFIRPARNNGGNTVASLKNDIETVHPVPADVKKVLQAACYDCHSNLTNYPWYANIQPIGWWLQFHIDEGKTELNFNEFASYSPRRQFNMMEGFIHQVKWNKMPLSSYLLMHKEAKLSKEQKQKLLDWAQQVRERTKRIEN